MADDGAATGVAAPIDLVDAGPIRLLDLDLVTHGADGTTRDPRGGDRVGRG